MTILVREETIGALPEYGRVPISFSVMSRLRIQPIDNGLGGLLLIEEPVAVPYIKDYDSLPGEGPAHWPEFWDLSHWGILSAFAGETRIGGAAVAWKTQGVEMLEGRTDLAVLWDLRVHPDYRGRGVGHRLFAHAMAWAQKRACTRLKIETQNINVPACRFYALQGCTLGSIHRYAYQGAEQDEVQLLWYRDL